MVIDNVVFWNRIGMMRGEKQMSLLSSVCDYTEMERRGVWCGGVMCPTSSVCLTVILTLFYSTIMLQLALLAHTNTQICARSHTDQQHQITRGTLDLTHSGSI